VPQQPLLPTYAQVITWTSALLDAHLTKLLLIEEYQPLLAELRYERVHQVNASVSLSHTLGTTDKRLRRTSTRVERWHSWMVYCHTFACSSRCQ